MIFSKLTLRRLWLMVVGFLGRGGNGRLDGSLPMRWEVVRLGLLGLGLYRAFQRATRGRRRGRD